VKTHVAEKGQWERELAVEVEADRIEAEVSKAYVEYQKRAEVPGFRRGKVPMRLIEARFGESIRERVVFDLLPDLVREATEAAGLVAASPPTIAEMHSEPGADLRFTARLEIWPQIDVQNYEGLEVTRATHQLTDAEVEEELQELRQRHATEREVERPLASGDVLVADLQRLDDADLPVIGERYTERRFLLGQADAASPQLEEALLGLRVGEERNVRFAYRSDLPDPRLAGTTDHFLVSARQIHERTVPELDDEFAKDVGEQFHTLDQLRAHLRQQAGERWRFLLEQRFRGELLSRLAVANPFELPASLVERYVKAVRRGASRGQDREGQAEPELSDEERQYAERRLRQMLLMEGLRRKLDVQIEDGEQLEALLRRRAEESGTTVEDLKGSGRADDLRQQLADDKVFELLSASARITEQVV
jgi:trigger factor